MREKAFRYIYGPVPSWRLGVSLGIDLLSSNKKICNFNCIYCQLGKTLGYTKDPKEYVKTSEVIAELEMIPRVNIDYITVSGRGEPCLAENLGKTLRAAKELKIAPVAVLTNASLIDQADISRDLSFADFVIAKLDAHSQESLERINQPEKAIRFERIIQGIKRFKNNFKGKFALQMMFVEQNQKGAQRLAGLAREINPDVVQINTPTRPCGVKALSKEGIARINRYFSGMNFISVYDIQPRKVVSFSKAETLKRRGKVIKL